MIDRAKTFDDVVQASGWRQINGPLFRKYVALLLAVIFVVLLISGSLNGLLEIGVAYQQHKGSLVRIQREQAEAAAAKIGQFIKEIENQVGWTTQLPWSTGTIDQRKFDGSRVLRQVPAITELAQLDATGEERLRQSKLGMDVQEVRSIFPMRRNSPRPWPRTSTTGRSISAANPSRT
jgi:two-component system, NtrC family, sensor kinase